MAENESFFRKVVRFVANPATDWTDLNSRQEDTRELDLEKSELKAMIERKRRNDFVRKREFDMLRRVRREGLSPEQLATLGTSSRIDDSEVRMPEGTSRPEGVKAKIDEIEQQMVGEPSFSNSTRRPPGATLSPTEPAVLQRPLRPPLPTPPPMARARADEPRQPAPPPVMDIPLPPPSAPAPMQMASALPPLAPLQAVSFASSLPPVPAPVAAAGADFDSPFAVEVSEVMHDPELDEAVIAFANADFSQCEEALQRITGPGSGRAQHAETWLVLFDPYRATGQQPQFESLALDYAQQFGWSAPQWYSLPKLVADAVNEDGDLANSSAQRGGGEVGWICPDLLDIEEVARLRSQTLQMPLPWVFDWGHLRSVDAEAAMQLSTLFRLWAGQAIEMRWIAGERLFGVLGEAAPTGVRDADPVFWLTRLDALRLANRADQFDETAIDYCVTYEVSPPSWEPARCKVQVSGANLNTRTPSMSVVSDVSTGFLESGLTEDQGNNIAVANVELSGQLVGDIGATLARLQGQLGSATVVNVSCARLIRVDFIAAGDLLNWVLARRQENRAVQFTDTHRLVALFFSAMGINEHAKVAVRKV
ncbi:conserved hypothetical protein [Rubrivivax sp. A210]|uniref:STAS domain-containing protein n=1 Tax=Rubrivivax sp. A210 TaxID=2772301 RepID=UPI00191AA079|nr:STAS domain-containing protein [Rubrivivax sp. A210]CAD5374076.1 conserved hypothetical protein [Rubrivivax sp. A210]